VLKTLTLCLKRSTKDSLKDGSEEKMGIA
jgi:hypothetical protein